jgi:spermidine/putrescine transport system permease protein
MSAERRSGRSDPAPVQRVSGFLALPSIAWLLIFFLIPLVIVAVYSFAQRGTYGGVEFTFSAQNYARVLDWIYFKVFWQSLKLATATSFSCLLIGYPMAFVMASASRRWKSILLILVVIPFWTNFVVRTYAIKAAFSETGPVNHWILSLGWRSEPFAFSGTYFAIWLGMLTNYLPFMVLPLYVVLEKFDFGLLEAARDLGATRWQQLTRILIPLTQSGIVTGLVFVFAPALGEFVIPDLLGGARTMLVGNLMTEQFLKTRDWPFGSALSMLLISAAVLCVLILKSISARKDLIRGQAIGEES